MTDQRAASTIQHPVRRMIDGNLGIAVGEAVWRTTGVRPWFPGASAGYGAVGDEIVDAASRVVEERVR